MKKISMRSKFKSNFIKLIVFTLTLQTFASFNLTSAHADVVAACTTQFSVTAKHDSVFYFDSGTSITAGYTAYLIKNTGTAGTYWAKIDNFTGDSLSLADYENSIRPLGSMALNAE
ncbi:MAG: hypothetical protein ACR2IU_05290 [Candidatus Nanopelagicaceae bacterium]